MTPSSAHDDFTAAAAAYAIDALDRDERAAFEAHMATCDQCRADLAEYRRVAGGLGLSAERLEPRPSLKAEVIAKATGNQPRVSISGERRIESADRDGNRHPGLISSGDASGTTLPWWLLIAASMAFVGMALYAWSLHSQLGDVREMATLASKEAQAARAELAVMRQQSVQVTRTLAAVTASDTIQVQLAGEGAVKSAKAHAYLSRATQSVVFTADSLPALPAGQVYQLWVLAPSPVSMGVLSVSANGQATMTAILAPGLGPVKAIAVSQEQGPNGSPAPTKVLLVGAVKGAAGN